MEDNWWVYAHGSGARMMPSYRNRVRRDDLIRRKKAIEERPDT
jgi:hypothetical protein